MIRAGCCVGDVNDLSLVMNTYGSFPTIQCMYTGLNYNDVAKIQEIYKTRGQNLYIHCPLNANPVKNTLSIVREQCKYLEQIPGSGVLHIGNAKYGGTVETVAMNINKINLQHGRYNSNRYVLLLENSAGQGNDLGWTWDQIRKLYEGLDRTTVGLCFDTQHAFAAGMVSFADDYSVDQMFENINAICERPSLIHLNDSKVAFAKRVDRHQNLGHGHIWSRDLSSLKRLKEYCCQLQIDIILETPSLHINDDLRIIYTL